MKNGDSGFTLIELMIVVAIVAILSAVAVAQYNSMVRKSEDGISKANLGMLRSALAIYYTDNDGAYPSDNLACLSGQGSFLKTSPVAHVMPVHPEMQLVTAEVSPSDTGGWSYNNDNASATWGSLRLGCTHADASGRTWSSF